jgi:hypothetical protein
VEAYQQIGTIAVLVALMLVVLAFWRRVDGVELTAALMLVFLAVTAGLDSSTCCGPRHCSLWPGVANLALPHPCRPLCRLSLPDLLPDGGEQPEHPSARYQLGGRWVWDATLGDALKTADPTIVADVVRALRAAGFRELDDWRLPEELLDES